MKPNPKNRLHPDNLAAVAIAPLVAYAAQNPHGVTDIADRMNRLGGTKILRQQVYWWVHPDAAKRVEPRLGIGILLGAVAEQLESEDLLICTPKSGWQTTLETPSRKR